MTDSVDRLYTAVLAARDADPASSRTARLLRSGRAKIAKKLAEEAVEVVIDAVDGDTRGRGSRKRRPALQSGGALGRHRHPPDDVWKEMARRERLFGIAEKLPKQVRLEPDARRARSWRSTARRIAQAALSPLTAHRAAASAWTSRALHR